MVTVLGATGFIGSNLVALLKEKNIGFYAPARNEDLQNRDLGSVIYCIGLTADFRTKPFETVEAHVCKLKDVLENCTFNSLTYLSSTRVYINSTNKVASESDKILIDPLDPEELYTLTKLTGERLCLSSKKKVKIVRLSNICGYDYSSANFISDIVKTIEDKGELVLNSSLSSSKDYLFISDAVEMILQIALHGTGDIYNLASGKNVSNDEIIAELKKHKEFSFEVNPNARELIFPKISTQKIIAEFNFQAKDIHQYISTFFKKTQDVQN